MNRKRDAIFKRVLDILAALVVILIVSIVFSGGFTVKLPGATISCRNLLNPILIVILLGLLRICLSIGLANSIAFLLGLILAAGMTEGILRITDIQASLPELKNLTRPSPILGYELASGLEGRKIRINSHGLRDRERGWEKPANTKRILGIGDSFTFGYQVKLDECYLKQLERLLNRNGRQWDVINAGVPGYNMWQYLAYFRHYGYRYQPDIATVGVFFDDFREDPPGRGAPARPDRNRSLSFLRTANLVRNAYELIKYRYRHVLGASWLRSVEQRKALIKGGPEGPILEGTADPEIYRRFENRLAELAMLSRERGVLPLVFLIPDVTQLGNPEFQAVNEILERICSRRGVDFIDMTPIFEGIEEPEKLYLLPHDAHTSPLGHRIIASRLHQWVLETQAD